jgi:hypothetical protein
MAPLARHRLRRPAQQRRSLRAAPVSAASNPTAPIRRSSTSPPTAKATATTTSTARWRWPGCCTRCRSPSTNGLLGRRLTNYGEFLEKYPPKLGAQIVETPPGAASMASSAGAPTAAAPAAARLEPANGARPCAKLSTSSPRCRAPLAEASPIRLFKDPGARNAYIDVVLDRSRTSRDPSFGARAPTTLNEEERTRALMN